MNTLQIIFLSVLLALVLTWRRKKARGRFNWSVGPVTNKTKTNGDTSMDVKITNEQKIRLELAPVTATGKPATLDGKPTWEKLSGDSTVEVAEDGLSATLISSDTPGDSQFIVKADADLGEGVEEISDVIKLTVEGARAASLGLKVGTPEPK